MKASELKDDALDWAVALAGGEPNNKPASCSDCRHHREEPAMDDSVHHCDHPKAEMDEYGFNNYSKIYSRCPLPYPDPYSKYWRFGGPIIEKMMLAGFLIEAVDPNYVTLPPFKCSSDRWETLYRGDTMLIAAMRCYVASKLGDEVDIPDRLLQAA